MSNTKIKFYGDGEFWIDGKKRAKLYSDGDLYVDGKPAGKVYSDGDVYLWNKCVGKVYPDGGFWVNGKCVLKDVMILDYLNTDLNTASISSTETDETEETKPTFFSTPTTTPSIPSLDFSCLGCFGIFFSILILIACAIGWVMVIPGILLDIMKISVMGPLSIILIYGSMLYSIYAQWELGSRKGNSAFDYGAIRQSLSFLVITAALLFIDRLLFGILHHATFNQIVSSFFSALGIDSIWSLLLGLLLCILLGCPPAIVGALITTVYLKTKGQRANMPKATAVKKTQPKSTAAHPTQVKPILTQERPPAKTAFFSEQDRKICYYVFIALPTFLWMCGAWYYQCSFYIYSAFMQVAHCICSAICVIFGILYFKSKIRNQKVPIFPFCGYLLRFFLLQLFISLFTTCDPPFDIIPGFTFFDYYYFYYPFSDTRYLLLFLQSCLGGSIFPALLCWRYYRKRK